ncbi:MAG: cysteine--tRNA ligase, partial [Planctomycetes bacterium]|nr:cysteine--tRNA ligase [Planctomycetota bacterium]
FEQGMDDDLNVSAGLGTLFDFVRDVNRALDAGDLGAAAAGGAGEGAGAGRAAVRAALAGFLEVFGILPPAAVAGADALTPEEAALLAEREAARARKEWAAADALRGRLKARGITIEDVPGGKTRWKRG